MMIVRSLMAILMMMMMMINIIIIIMNVMNTRQMITCRWPPEELRRWKNLSGCPPHLVKK